MYRNALAWLHEWLGRSDRKPLVIRGARQTGKSTLVRLFAEACGRTLVEVNLEEEPRYARTFALREVHAVLRSLEVLLNTTIVPDRSILFIDEIQAAPEAIALLRFFHERIPQLPVVAAGSLIEFALSETPISMPVGRIEFLFLGPMTFSEFLRACEGGALADLIDGYTVGDDLPEPVHREALERVRHYTLVGGMPEVVATWARTGSFVEAERVKHGLVTTFRDDFLKYRGRQNLESMQTVFDRLGSTVGRKIVYRSLLPEEPTRRVENALRLFEQARLIYRVFHSSANGVPLRTQANPSYAKGILLDIGLLQTLGGLVIAENALAGPLESLLFANEGSLAEQFVGQHLLSIGPPYAAPEVYHWRREHRSSGAEVDYLVQLSNRVVPIEVKSGAAGTLRSLHVFMEEKRLDRAVRFYAGPPRRDVVSSSLSQSRYTYELVNLPFYLVEQLPRLIG